MNILVILAHPQPGSFNHAIAASVVHTLEGNGHTVVFHDLYTENFDSVLPGEEIAAGAPVPPGILTYCRELAQADGIVIVHPNWWGMPPAILKGFVDRVFRPEVAYKFLEGDSGEGVPLGFLKARAALVFNTSNTPVEREQAVFGDPLDTLWKNCIFDLCGVSNVFRQNFGVIVTSTLEERQAWLREVQAVVGHNLPPV